MLFYFLRFGQEAVKKKLVSCLRLGEGKGEIIGQLLSENILIALLAMGAATCFTGFLTDKIGRYIIDKAGENVTDITVSIAASDMVSVYGIGLFLVCFAVFIASCTVIRLKPKDILTEMD